MKSSINVEKTDITQMDVDVIVNAANRNLSHGGGVCGAIFSRAGPHRLAKACSEIGGCETGSAVITQGFDLKAKYIIHAVSPLYMGVRSILKLRTFYIDEKRHMNYNPIWDYNEEAFYEIRNIKIIK